MLFAGQDGSSLAAPDPKVFSLGGQAVLVSLDVAGAPSQSLRLAGRAGTRFSPSMTLRLPLRKGGIRLVAVMLRPSEDAADPTLVISEDDWKREIVLDADSIARLQPASIIDGLSDRGKHQFASSLLGIWAQLLDLGQSAEFARLAGETVRSLAPRPEKAWIEAELLPGLRLVQFSLPRDFGAVNSCFLVASRKVRRLLAAPHLGEPARGAVRPSHLALDGEVDAEDALVIVGPRGIAVRQFASRSRVQLRQWLKSKAAADGNLREYVAESLGNASRSGRQASLEFQVSNPLPARAAKGDDMMPGAEVDVAIGVPGGMLLGGWYRDPGGLVNGLDLLDATGTRIRVDDHWHRFRGKVAYNGATKPATGFAALLPLPKQRSLVLQPRLLLRLSSGRDVHLVPRVQPATSAERRAAALRLVPPQHLSNKILETCLSPALSALQDEANEEIGEPSIVHIGPPLKRPKASIVVPVYRVLDFLKVQMATFAADPDVASQSELIYVLDSPEQADAVEHLLRGLNILYAMPLTLLVMERNAGFSGASNAGAAIARAPVLVFFNSDVVPVAEGWLRTLRRRVEGNRPAAVCGPKLLFGDGSIQHAGMYFARNAAGRWLNHHFHKGMPRRLPQAEVERPVPAVTGACLVIRRKVFEAVGGFGRDYVIGDYEDSDLCLKVRESGHEIVYVPQAELYHLERQSVRESADYMRGVAAQYNAWLHEQRWGAAMTQLMQERPDAWRQVA
jgi:GT2 family glycosyltransferase